MPINNPYAGREQTEAKHFILRRYLQALAFKVLRAWDHIAYVDGFSGPWESRTEDLSDTSFMIAISVLKEAQRQIQETTGRARRVTCFFSEENSEAHGKLKKAVARYHSPGSFEIVTYCGRFEAAIQEIRTAIGTAFPLIFIDPTGWTGYPFEKIRSMFAYRKCEVLINFMYDHINRFAASDDEMTRRSLDPILGGEGWEARLDKSMPRGLAVEKLFRETLKTAGNFAFVVSTRIEKSTIDRPHFYITYGTKDRAGLIAFRQTEYEALRHHAKKRIGAKKSLEEKESRIGDLFSDHQDQLHQQEIDRIVLSEKTRAAAELLALLQTGPIPFSRVVELLLQRFILRETNVKDICIELAMQGKLDRTWGRSPAKPKDTDIVQIRAS